MSVYVSSVQWFGCECRAHLHIVEVDLFGSVRVADRPVHEVQIQIINVQVFECLVQTCFNVVIASMTIPY